MAKERRHMRRRDIDLDSYDKHWFIKKEIVLEYRCSKCKNILKDPQQIIVCGHQFCGSCLPRDAKKCPECDKDVKQGQIIADEAVKRKVLALEIRCPSRHTCKWKGTLAEFIKKHKNECKLRLSKCRNNGCVEVLPREELDKHEQEECQYREINCQHCEERITVVQEKTHHENACKRIPVDCPQLCGAPIPREELQRHMDEECEKTPIDCIFKSVGCEDKVERGQLIQHEADMMHEHLSKAVDVIHNMKLQKQDMAQEIQELREMNNTLTQELRDLGEREETRANKIESDLNDFKELGQNELETVKKATEQNFENIALTVQKDNDLHHSLLSINEEFMMLKSVVIPGIQATCQLNKAGNQRLAETDDKLQKMIISVFKKFADQQQQTNTELETLRKADEMERAARLKHEDETSEQISELGEEITKNRSKLEKVKVELTVTQDEMKEGFSEHCEQMKLDYENLSDQITKEKQARENRFLQVAEEVKQMNSINTGVLIWRIDNVESALTKAKPLYGKTFYSDPYGYLLQPKIFFDGARPEDKGYVSIFIRILQGPFDPILEWPFRKRICLTLINQESNGIKRDIEKILIPDADVEELRRPTEDANNGFGIYKFVTKEVLRGEEYIADDVMFIKIEVLEDVQQNGPSETV